MTTKATLAASAICGGSDCTGRVFYTSTCQPCACITAELWTSIQMARKRLGNIHQVIAVLNHIASLPLFFHCEPPSPWHESIASIFLKAYEMHDVSLAQELMPPSTIDYKLEPETVSTRDRGLLYTSGHALWITWTSQMMRWNINPQLTISSQDHEHITSTIHELERILTRLNRLPSTEHPCSICKCTSIGEINGNPQSAAFVTLIAYLSKYLCVLSSEPWPITAFDVLKQPQIYFELSLS